MKHQAKSYLENTGVCVKRQAAQGAAGACEVPCLTGGTPGECGQGAEPSPHWRENTGKSERWRGFPLQRAGGLCFGK